MIQMDQNILTLKQTYSFREKMNMFTVVRCRSFCCLLAVYNEMKVAVKGRATGESNRR